MLYIAACGNEASVRKYLKEMEGEYVREDVQILCGDEIEGSGTMPDVLFLSDSGIEECQKKIPVWFRRKAFDNAGELKQRKAGAERKRPLLIKTDGTYCCVDQKTILYAESVGRKVVLHTNTGIIAYYARMKEVEEILGNGFFRCHRGYLVNFAAVKSFEVGTILLKNGESILMAKQKRIYNRDQSAILGARNNRLAKMRAFSSSTKTRASSKGTTQSAPKSKNYRTSAWMQFLNQFQNGTAVSGDKIVENQKKSYDYEITGLAAERVETHMKRFLEEGEKSLYQEGEDAGKQLTKEMESFVSDYNMMIRKIGDLSDSVDETYAKKLKTEISARETALKQIGITLEKDGTLSFDKTVFQTVKPEAVQKIFGDKSTLSNRVQVLASGVKSNCRKQAAALLATSYMTSGNYSRYASDSNQTRQTGSRYNAKG